MRLKKYAGLRGLRGAYRHCDSNYRSFLPTVVSITVCAGNIMIYERKVLHSGASIASRQGHRLRRFNFLPRMCTVTAPVRLAACQPFFACLCLPIDLVSPPPKCQRSGPLFAAHCSEPASPSPKGRRHFPQQREMPLLKKKSPLGFTGVDYSNIKSVCLKRVRQAIRVEALVGTKPALSSGNRSGRIVPRGGQQGVR